MTEGKDMNKPENSAPVRSNDLLGAPLTFSDQADRLEAQSQQLLEMHGRIASVCAYVRQLEKNLDAATWPERKTDIKRSSD